LDSEKARRLEKLGLSLVAEAESFEKDNEYGLAIEKYLKVVDILLLLAESAPDYPLWLKLSDRAASYQKKVRGLIAKASLKQERQERSEVSAGPAMPAAAPTSSSTTRSA
jgi:hypothetical protein